MFENFTEVGKVKDAHGLKGELFILLYAGEADWDVKSSKIYIQLKDALVLLELLGVKVHKNGLILKAKNFSDRTSAESVKGSKIFIENSDLTAAPGERVFLRELQDFLVIDERLGEIGPVVGFSSNGIQDLLLVRYQEREVQIPLVDAFLQKIDMKSKRLQMCLPEGLLEAM